MAENLSGGIPAYEASDLKRFTLAATLARPNTVAFQLWDPNGGLLPVSSISPVNSGIFAVECGNLSGIYYVDVVLPDTAGFYISEWIAYNATSQTGRVKEEFEVIRTEARSFFTYGNAYDIVRTARQIFGRSNVTVRDLQDYMEPADGLINGYLGHLGDAITLPLSTVPPLVRDWHKSLVLWSLYSDRFGVKGEDAPTGLQDRYDKVIEQLEALKDGEAVLQISSGYVIQAGYDFFCTNENRKPIFDFRDWEAQRINPLIVEADYDEDVDD